MNFHNKITSKLNYALCYANTKNLKDKFKFKYNQNAIQADVGYVSSLQNNYNIFILPSDFLAFKIIIR
jgi:hypothetical protein